MSSGDIASPLLSSSAADSGGAAPSAAISASPSFFISRLTPLRSASPNILATAAGAALLIAGPFSFLLILLLAGGGSSAAMAAVIAWMFIWWVSESVPLPITALLPLFLLPLLRIQTSSVVSSSYANDTVFLVLGSFLMVAALQAHGVEEIIASAAVRACSASSRPRLVLAAFCIVPAFISMWLDNAAAAGVLVPVAMAVQRKLLWGFEKAAAPGVRNRGGSAVELDFCRGITLSVTFSITIGGMSTITGNAVNLILVGLWEAEFPAEDDLSYIQWMLFGVPLSVALTFCLWVVMCVFFCPSSAVEPLSASLASIAGLKEDVETRNDDDDVDIDDEARGLDIHHSSSQHRPTPPWMPSSKTIVLAAYFVLVVLWMTRSFTGNVSGWADLFDDYPSNGSVTILVATLLFVIPDPMNPREKLMNWSHCKNIPWNIILLIGGGFAVADGIRTSGLSDVITEHMTFLESTPYWAITPAVAIVSSVFTEFTANAATASIIVPLVAEIAMSMNRHPLSLMIPAALASQFSYMLPVATGPNAIAYATDSLRIMDMAIPGIFLKICAVILLSVLMPTLGVVVFNINSPVTV